MSRYFQAGDLSLWNPSNRVADLFVRTGEAVAALTEVPSGIGPMIADEYEVDPKAFAAFVDALTKLYLSISHAILRPCWKASSPQRSSWWIAPAATCRHCG